MPDQDSEIPIVDLRAPAAAAAIGRACCRHGFFYVVGHGVAPGLRERLERVARRFFALDVETKLAIGMRRGGRAWRGYFPIGAELTDGRPDHKEGIYFGAELDEQDPRVRAALPLHGRNLFPDLPGFAAAVLAWLEVMTGLGHELLAMIAISLGLERSYFHDRYTRDPLILFRIFHYPALAAASDDWSVGEHTDYGLLTILAQDDTGGLQIRSPTGWVDAAPIEDAFVCNIGDMLDRLTGGRYRSTPHRVRNASGRDRLSMPFFFDPAFDAEVAPIDPHAPIADDARERWDRASVHDFQGTYGDYLMRKVARVFPRLGGEVL